MAERYPPSRIPAVDTTKPRAAEPEPLRPEDIPLSLLAEARLASTGSYDLGYSLEPLLRRTPVFAKRLVELDELEERYACWQLTDLAYEVEEGAPARVLELMRGPYEEALDTVRPSKGDRNWRTRPCCMRAGPSSTACSKPAWR